MLSLHVQNSITTYKKSALFILAFCLSSPAYAVSFNLNPGAISPGSPSATVDTLVAGEVSNISFIDQYADFKENGYGFISGAQLNGSTLSGTGLSYALDNPATQTSQSGAYSLYFQFSDTGNAYLGQIYTGSFNFYAVSGQSTFSINNANIAQVANTGTPISLGSATLNFGSVATSNTGLSANIGSATFTPTVAGTAFFGLSDPTYNLTGSFSHSFLDGGVVPVTGGYDIYGGYDRLNFTALTSATTASSTPELQEWLMLIIGLPCIAWVAQRRQGQIMSDSFLRGKHAILG